MNKPQIKILSVSNVYSRLMYFKKGDVEEGHFHPYDHGTLLASGSLNVKMLNDDGTTKSQKSFKAPTFIFIKKNEKHLLTALEDNTVASCIHALRSIDGEIVSPAFMVEQVELADSPNDATEDKPVVSNYMNKQGESYKPLATLYRK
jgi:quercetin dioxygenase-like cupin family protein